MYAIIANGGKQYKVEQGQVLRLEKMTGDVGQSIDLGPVLMVGGEGEAKIGQPHLEGQVSATILEQGKSKKIMILKKKRRKGYRRHQGHRQDYTEIQIDSIKS